MNRLFDRLSVASSEWASSSSAFMLAVGVVVGWAVAGPFAGYSTTWQLIINTGTTIVNFLLAFLILNAEDKNSSAMQLKLDAIAGALEGAPNAVIHAEKLDRTELCELKERIDERLQALS